MRRCLRALAGVILLSLAAGPAASAEVEPAIAEALDRLYNFAFDDAQAILDDHIERRPDDPLGHLFRAAGLLFYELDRLKILESEFFEDDARIASRTRLAADPAIKRRLMAALDRTEALARDRLEADPDDADALFALCLRQGLLTDYVGLVERRRLKSFAYAREAQSWARRLLEIDPTFYDAHLSSGVNEYLLGSVPFFVRWFVRIEGVEGSKSRAVRQLELVAERGSYLGPFARILLSIIALRERQPERALALLSGLRAAYPENPLFRKEQDLVARKLASGELKAR